MTESPPDWRPVPDPTRLTTEQLRRELDNATAEIRREIEATRMLLDTSIANEVRRNDERHDTLLVTIDRRFGEVHRLTDDASRQATADNGHLRELHEERFAGITLQFAERDVRTEQAATASASALAAALQAAKEAVFEQAQAAAKAAEKTELSTTKLLDQVQLQIRNLGDTFTDRIGELKERIDRGEGSQAGESGQRNETRLNVGAAVSVGLLVVSVITFVILYAIKK